MSASSSNEPEPPSADRREFLKSAACCVLGGVCVLPPAIAATVVVLSPLRKPASDGVWVNLAKLDTLTAGAVPRLFEVFVERTDAWTRHARSAIGSVFVERLGEREVRAFHSSCPHLGCAVGWRDERNGYYCPCHDSTFERAGGVVGKSPAARGLDALAVEIRGDGEVWVKFQNFKAGIKDKVPVA